MMLYGIKGNYHKHYTFFQAVKKGGHKMKLLKKLSYSYISFNVA